MADRPPVVELEDVRAGYGRRVVLDGATLSVQPGEVVALLGTNGSGKSTLLRVAAGLMRPWSGEARLFGQATGAWTPAELARRVAVLPQSLELPVGFRVAEAVALGRIPHARGIFGTDAADAAAVADALRDADAGDLAEREVSELSGGERQRVLVAMALAQEPSLLLLDEPTLHLDLAHQLTLVRTLARLRRVRDLTVVAVVHDLNLAAGMADRAVLLDGGRVRPAGRGDQVVDATLVRDALGVPIEVALTLDGHRVLAPVNRSE
jgi:iron complex transport system ATP-binding protein